MTSIPNIHFPKDKPVIIFALLMFIVLFVPILSRKIRIPSIVGLIISGIVVGPYGLNILLRDSSIVLFGTMGLMYIMFVAGLEIDSYDFRKKEAELCSSVF